MKVKVFVMTQAPKVEGYDTLASLALDMQSCWNHGADDLWRQLDPSLWDLTHNPWVVLRTASRKRLGQLLADPAFRRKVDNLAQARDHAASTPAWFQQSHANSPLGCVAYFSMEFMLSEALPIYSGGLGNVAGDQLKAASDLGVPVVGVGLLYQQGYFRQEIDKDGAQQALYPYNDPGQLPIKPLRKPDGEWLRLEIVLPGYSVWLRAWQVQVGRVNLYLLDTNDAANFPSHRGITSELYGGGPELRLKQELVLGIGGWRLLGALGIEPQVCHLNEGHAALAVLERARGFMQRANVPFDVALAVTRAGNVFTTHTAVEAGFDRFPPALIEQYLGAYVGKLGVSLHDLLALGRQNPNDAGEAFNMAYLAIRGSGSVNGVSRLHGEVSRRLFAPLYPRWPIEEVPVGYVTNGIHVPTWDSAPADELWTQSCGQDRWQGNCESMEMSIQQVPDAKLWALRSAGRRSLIEFARHRLSRQLAVNGETNEVVEQVKHLFDPDVLTLGFARRFATYKRPNLLLHDPERLVRLLTNQQRPVQLILAGKAHPADKAGQALIKQWMHFIWRPQVRAHAVFLVDYDMLLTEHLVGGVDVWLNTPRRPWEACGTSGMKVLVNGGLNLSTMDGWWEQAYTPQVGWSIGDGREHGDDAAQDAADAQALYNQLEREVIPMFYDRNKEGIPSAWVARMRQSMASLAPQFSASRAVCEYTEQHYIPAATNYLQRSADQGAAGREIVDWQKTVAQNWAGVRLGQMKVEDVADQRRYAIEVFHNELQPADLRVELFANAVNGHPLERHEMTPDGSQAGGSSYAALLPAQRPASDYTVRVVLRHPGVAVPQEQDCILWQH